MTEPTIHLSNVTSGYAEVWHKDHIIGSVESINRPHVINSRCVKFERWWEARKIVGDSYSFSTFPTRREAVNHLVEEY